MFDKFLRRLVFKSLYVTLLTIYNNNNNNLGASNNSSFWKRKFICKNLFQKKDNHKTEQLTTFA
jgi:hypothetical protein